MTEIMEDCNILRLSFRKVRDRRKLKLVDLASLSGLNQSTLSTWLSCRHDLSSQNLSKLLEAAETLSSGSIAEFAFLLSGGGLQDKDQIADILDLVAFEYRKLKDKDKICV
jgi:transcriptional regulator with XRE-family HTH domain